MGNFKMASVGPILKQLREERGMILDPRRHIPEAQSLTLSRLSGARYGSSPLMHQDDKT